MRPVQIVALWWNAESVLLALRQPSDAAALAAQYCRRLIVSLPFVFAFEALRRFCQVQGVVNPMLYVSIVADVLHPFWCWLYIYKLGLGFEGAGKW
jgi:multidrug resistance protein, MATE family